MVVGEAYVPNWEEGAVSPWARKEHSVGMGPSEKRQRCQEDVEVGYPETSPCGVPMPRSKVPRGKVPRGVEWVFVASACSRALMN